MVGILNRLAKLYGTADGHEPRGVGWREFETTTDDEVETLDEALFDVAHLIAGLAAADGAVVMSKENELLGFGGMISGRLEDVESVMRALDLEGERVVEETTGNAGARHRSAYRLAGALPGSVAIVIFQDGGVRFVCQRETAESHTGSKSEPTPAGARVKSQYIAVCRSTEPVLERLQVFRLLGSRFQVLGVLGRLSADFPPLGPLTSCLEPSWTSSFFLQTAVGCRSHDVHLQPRVALSLTKVEMCLSPGRAGAVEDPGVTQAKISPRGM